MNVIEAIFQRKSIRGFKPDPVDPLVIKKLLEAAIRAPSAMNSQPWEFFVISGKPLDRIRSGLLEKTMTNTPKYPEYTAVEWPQDGIYRKRRVDLAKQIFQLMGIGHEDKEKRDQWFRRAYRIFDAPMCIVVVTDKSLGPVGPVFEIGAAVENLCLAAIHYGLGTCIENQAVYYPDVVREHAGIPDHKRIMIAIAIGYPDPDFPANQLESRREPVDNVTTWIVES